MVNEKIASCVKFQFFGLNERNPNTGRLLYSLIPTLKQGSDELSDDLSGDMAFVALSIF